MSKKRCGQQRPPIQNGPNPNAPWHAPSTSSICQQNTASQSVKLEMRCGKGPEGDTDLFRGVDAEHHGVFRADDHFVLDAHSDAVKVFGKLRVGRDVDTFLLTWRSRRQHGGR